MTSVNANMRSFKLNTEENPSPRSGTTSLKPPEIVLVTHTSESSIKITWAFSTPVTNKGVLVKWGTNPSESNTTDQKDRPFQMGGTFEITELKPGTKYYIFVCGTIDDAVSRARSVEGTTKPATALPGRPTNLQAWSSKSTVLLKWDAAANASGYKIAYGIEPGPIINTLPSPEPTINFTGLISNTLYFFQVRSTNSNGESASTDIKKQTLKVPATPTNLTATPQVTTMELSWDIPQDAATFHVCHGLEPGGAAKCIDSKPPRYTLTGLNKNTLYYVEVIAEGLNGGSLPARIIQRTLDGPPIPSRPGSLFVTASYDTVNLVWPTSHESGTEYEITYGLKDKYPEVIGRHTTEYLNYVVKYLAPATQYFIVVRAFNASGYSQPVRADVTIGPDRTQPRNLRNPGRTFSEAWLRWNVAEDSSYLTDYEITGHGGAPVLTTARECIVTGLVPGKEYLLKVQPRRPVGPVPALPVSIPVETHDRAPPTRPQALKLTPSTLGNATLDWRASEDNVGVTGYEVRRNGGAWISVSGTSHAVTGLIDGIPDTFEVRAKDAAENLSRIAYLARPASAGE